MTDTWLGLLVFICLTAVGFGLFLVAKYAGVRRLWTKAYIADTMVPLVTKHLTNRSSIDVIGADCRYLADKARWRGALDQWLGMGCSVRYLIYKPHERARGVLKELAQKHPAAFKVQELMPPEELKDNDGDKELLTELETFHFMVMNHPRQLWIEGEHPLDRTEAYNCEYVPPRLAERDPRFKEYSAAFERVWSKYSRNLN